MVNSETIEVTVNPNVIEDTDSMSTIEQRCIIVLRDCEALVRSVPVMPEDFCEAI